MIPRCVVLVHLLGHVVGERATISMHEADKKAAAKADYQGPWKHAGLMACDTSDRKELPDSASLDECGIRAMLDPNCETQPYSIYIREKTFSSSLECRCVKKGQECDPDNMNWQPADVYTATASDLPAVQNLELKILATRHGLSCANLVSHWKSGLASLGHVLMPDPLLAGAGKANSVSASSEVKKWLTKNGLKVDALISSVLLRAMQTAALEYPQELFSNITRVLYTAPYLREHGTGQDNSPSKLVDQVRRSAWSVSTGTHIDSKFTFDENNRMSKGDWDRFKAFLASDFFPYLFEQGVGNRETVTLAVVTHSNFMNSGEIAAKCKQHYPPQPGGKVKAWNNQVVALSYKLSVVRRADGTDFYEISDKPDASGKCEPVATGMPFANNPITGQVWQLCEADVGEDCKKSISGIQTREEIISKLKDGPTKENYKSTPCLTGGLPAV